MLCHYSRVHRGRSGQLSKTTIHDEKNPKMCDHATPGRESGIRHGTQEGVSYNSAKGVIGTISGSKKSLQGTERARMLGRCFPAPNLQFFQICTSIVIQRHRIPCMYRSCSFHCRALGILCKLGDNYPGSHTALTAVMFCVDTTHPAGTSLPFYNDNPYDPAYDDYGRKQWSEGNNKYVVYHEEAA